MKYKNLLIGLTGSADLLKINDYLAQLSLIFTNIRIITTESSCKIINKNALSIFADHVYTDNESNLSKINHINISEWADVFVVVPATANFLGKVANGIADDLLTTTALAYGNNLVICPNMNQKMWLNPILQENYKKLKSLNYNFIGPTLQNAYETSNKTISKQYVVPDIDTFCKSLKEILFEHNLHGDY